MDFACGTLVIQYHLNALKAGGLDQLLNLLLFQSHPGDVVMSSLSTMAMSNLLTLRSKTLSLEGRLPIPGSLYQPVVLQSIRHLLVSSAEPSLRLCSVSFGMQEESTVQSQSIEGLS